MRKLMPFLLLVLLGVLGWGFASILSIRFSNGEVYPAGSSLRVDRVGTRVLFDSLARLRPTERNFKTIDDGDLRGVTVLILHATSSQIEEGSWKSLTRRGARVLFAFAPAPIQRANRELKELEVALRYSAPTEEMRDTPAWESGRETTLTLKAAAPVWTVLAPGSILERPFEKGSVVLAGNADFFSNQTLAQQRSPAMLARMIGPAQRVIFDESHFGIRDDPSVMVLVRKYGLTGVVLALIVLAALFLWQAAFPLVPLPPQSASTLELHSERTTQSGLAQLLRRGIAPPALMAVCAREWERVSNHTPTQREAVHRALADAADPVTAFARATLALERKR